MYRSGIQQDNNFQENKTICFRKKWNSVYGVENCLKRIEL